ncbi:radical SAM protein [Candidatus Latescibacterota bacterium]
MNSFVRTLSLARRGIINYFTKRPFCVSFEITHNCNARCRHCHREGAVDKLRASPERFGEIFHELKPLVIQISGGEPLLRRDGEQVIEALKQPDGTPYIIFVTNAALLTEEKYYSLLEKGVDFFSISLDYPDERHDKFRNIPGLFRNIETLITKLDSSKDKAITLNSVVQSNNYRELPRMAELARDWSVAINFSPYTWLRTHDKSYMIPKEEIPEFKRIVKLLIEFKKNYNTVRTADSFFYDMVDFFENESVPNCRAGERFLVVNPDGTLSPCGLIITDYPSWEALKEGFTKNNTCTYCHTCIRSSTENPFNNLITGALQILKAR